jgi:hypothetical protein
VTDRELLQCAAKAAGFPQLWWGDWKDSVPYYGDIPFHHTWDPLKSDGDALRLAVMLKFSVSIGTNLVLVYAETRVYEEKAQKDSGEFYAATRRAIVRAAASIRTPKVVRGAA